MKTLAIFLPAILIGCILAQHAEIGDVDPKDGMNEDEFEKYFGLPKVKDPAEKARRLRALKKAEADVEAINKAYKAGKSSWFEEINEYSDLPQDEFEKKHTGEKDPKGDSEGFFSGELEPSEEERYHEESERYFEQERLDRSYVPDSYSSVARGYVSPIRNQRSCGSCVAFASTAVIEVVMKKATGKFGDYAEQQLVDCGFRKNGANGCDGAPPHAYIYWAGTSKLEMAHEATYPYKAKRQSCPRYLKPYRTGAKITSSYYTYRGNEEMMKKMVYKHGAVVGSVYVEKRFNDWRGGVFSGGPRGRIRTNHAIAVVGYGTENGKKYWLIKNSYGPGWGDKGFIKIERGVNMSGIGTKYSVAIVSRDSRPTSRPLVTKKPCFDKWSNCNRLARTSCWKVGIKRDCIKSCGLCQGMTPVRSNTCYDKYSNCGSLRRYCYQSDMKTDCKKTCRQC